MSQGSEKATAMDVEKKEGEAVGKKRKAAKKEEKAPEDKRPMNAFMKWMNGPEGFRAKYKETHPDAKTPEIGAASKEAWAALSAEEKAPLE